MLTTSSSKYCSGTCRLHVSSLLYQPASIDTVSPSSSSSSSSCPVILRRYTGCHGNLVTLDDVRLVRGLSDFAVISLALSTALQIYKVHYNQALYKITNRYSFIQKFLMCCVCNYCMSRAFNQSIFNQFISSHTNIIHRTM